MTAGFSESSGGDLIAQKVNVSCETLFPISQRIHNFAGLAPVGLREGKVNFFATD
jgi:hypothetical protein